MCDGIPGALICLRQSRSPFIACTSLLPPEAPNRASTAAGRLDLQSVLLSLALACCGSVSAQDASSAQPVSALGRLEPEHGITRLAASSTPEATMGGTMAELFVKEGDEVSKGQLLATTDTTPVMQAVVAEAEAELEFALREVEAASSKVEEACVRADVSQREAERRARLHAQGVAGEEEADSAQGEAEAMKASCSAAKTAVRSSQANTDVARARLTRVQAELKRSYLYSPIDGRVLDVKAKPGEFIDAEGALILGNVKRMMAIAEVYETDIRRVRLGQRATVSSAALDADLSGKVHFIQQMVAKQDEIGTDPAARKDARIIEVEILLDNPAAAAGMTNLQVDVVIHP
jgi:HlyD family secretion protein